MTATPYDHKDWPWTLYVEGEELPGVGCSLELLDLYLPEKPPDGGPWWVKASACVGSVRYDRAGTVRRFATEYGRLAATHAGHVMGVIDRMRQEDVLRHTPSFPVATPKVVLGNWINALRRMAEIAETRQWCAWIAGYEQDRAFLLSFAGSRAYDDRRSVSGEIARLAGAE